MFECCLQYRRFERMVIVCFVTMIHVECHRTFVRRRPGAGVIKKIDVNISRSHDGLFVSMEAQFRARLRGSQSRFIAPALERMFYSRGERDYAKCRSMSSLFTASILCEPFTACNFAFNGTACKFPCGFVANRGGAPRPILWRFRRQSGAHVSMLALTCGAGWGFFSTVEYAYS